MRFQALHELAMRTREAHLDTVTKCESNRKQRGAGKPSETTAVTAALRSVGGPPADCGSVPLPFLVVVSRCSRLQVKRTNRLARRG